MIELSGGFDAADLIAAFKELQAGLDGRLQAATEATAEAVQKALREKAPVGVQVPGGREPGGLRRSVRFDVNGLRAEFFAAYWSEFVIGGTEPHTIFPVNRKVLRWFSTGANAGQGVAGGWTFAMRVRHPGTKPNDFRAPALDDAAVAADEQLEKIFAWVGEVI